MEETSGNRYDTRSLSAARDRRGGTGLDGPQPDHDQGVTDDTDGHYGLIVSEAPRGSAPPMHIHHRTDEAIWIIEGRLRLVCGESDVVIGAGAFTLLPGRIMHAVVFGQ